MSNTLEIQNLSVRVEGRGLIEGLSLKIPQGEIHALLGPNGCGKTTLMMAIMGYSRYKVTQGRICFDGQDITDLGITERARLGIGIAQQRPPTMNGVRLRHLLDYVIEKHPRQRREIDQLVKDFHIEPFLSRDINAGLSGGEIKRSELFQLFITRPKFAMMDEPDSGIDIESLALVGQMVNALLAPDPNRPAKRRAALIITHTGHILDYVSADKAHIMLNGRIAGAGVPNRLIDDVRRLGYEAVVINEKVRFYAAVPEGEFLSQLENARG